MSVLVVLGGAAGCTDPPFPSEPDGGSAPDSKADQPVSCTTDGWSCLEIGECAQTCGTDVSCVASCLAKGCASAKPLFQATQDCMVQSCLTKCVTGGNSQGCLDCSAVNCSAQTAACDAHQCSTICSDGDGSGATTDGGTAAGGDGGSAGSGCLDIYTCLGTCLIETSICQNRCEQRGCSRGQAAYLELVACASNRCGDDCFFYSSPECLTCMEVQCAGYWTTCKQNAC